MTASSDPDAVSWRVLRVEVEERLVDTAGDTAAVEARWIVLEASGLSDAELLVEGDEPVPSLARHQVEAMITRRAAGEPLQYVLGSWSFRGLDLMVDRRVLIPRPETETVVQAAIDELVRRGARVGGTDPWGAGITEFAVADLGTGSGAIALALASELPDAAVWATDVDEAALAVARANLASIGTAATRVRLLAGDWFDALPIELRGELRLVVSNPPYVSAVEHPALPPEVGAHEPYGALVSGETGLEHVEHLIAEAPAWLEPGGALVLELAPHQAAAASGAARSAGFVEVEIREDLSGRARALVARSA
ncbi:MAG: peptide chain release factor N(5)-glutamine methyltransferase [Acidimicrobiia bacterium]|jgi:release factor glutamine methyltransferase